jgi:predicted DNA-binding transcriptional regulator AlpA
MAGVSTCASSPERLLDGSAHSLGCMRTPEAARYVALSESTLTKMRLTGHGPPFVKVGPRAVAYRKADLDRWLDGRVRRSTSDNPAQEELRHSENVRGTDANA